MGFKVFRRKKIKLKETYSHEMLISYTRSVQEYPQIIILTIEATKKIDFLKLTDEETPLMSLVFILTQKWIQYSVFILALGHLVFIKN